MKEIKTIIKRKAIDLLINPPKKSKMMNESIKKEVIKLLASKFGSKIDYDSVVIYENADKSLLVRFNKLGKRMIEVVHLNNINDEIKEQ